MGTRKIGGRGKFGKGWKFWEPNQPPTGKGLGWGGRGKPLSQNVHVLKKSELCASERRSDSSAWQAANKYQNRYFKLNKVRLPEAPLALPKQSFGDGWTFAKGGGRGKGKGGKGVPSQERGKGKGGKGAPSQERSTTQRVNGNYWEIFRKNGQRRVFAPGKESERLSAMKGGPDPPPPSSSSV